MAEEMKLPNKLIVCVVAVLVVFLAYGVFLGPTHGPVWLHVLAMDQTEICGAINCYKIEYGTYPTTAVNVRLVKILTGDNPRKIEFIDLKPNQLNAAGEMIDPWGTPFQFSVEGDDSFKFTSAGKDKTFGTSDDYQWVIDRKGEATLLDRK